jgi:quinoprotein glucose dehydrogenase
VQRRVGILLLSLLLATFTGAGYLKFLEPAPDLADAPRRAADVRAAAATEGANRSPGDLKASDRSVTPTAWTHFAADAGATQYSPLDQITPDNVEELELAWTYRTGDAERHSGELARSSFANTPILAAGSLIVCTPWSRVIALDPVSGHERWAFDPEVTLTQPPEHRSICRGVAAWRDPNAPPGSACAERILFGTNDLRVVALDAATGGKCPGFARGGELRIQSDRPEQFPGELQLHGPPAIVNGTVVIGSAVSDHVRRDAPSGVVRAFDARTGEPRWTFDPIPRDPADPAAAGWRNGSAGRTGAANVWSDMSVDETRDLIYLSTSSPSLDFDGRARPGDNRYANSIVALRGSTGERVWHFQIVHHDLWDYDLPSAGLLTRLEVNGRPRDALIQLTKQGLVFVFDRETGEALFPIEERPVPQSELPDEQTSPTQPFPVTMPWLMGAHLAGADLTAADAWGFTPLDGARCRRRLESHRALGLYGPPSRDGTLTYPWSTGGSNHGMRAFDPERRLLIVNVIRTVGVLYAAPDHEPHRGYAPGSGILVSMLGAPCLKPPWGELIALDVERQQIVWSVPLGTVEQRAHLPAWLPLPLKFGTPSRGGPMLTSGGLTFVAGTMDDALRAFDTDTGRELWRTQLPAGGQATPMTYEAGGRQYVVIAAGGHAWMRTTPGDYVLAYALPD